MGVETEALTRLPAGLLASLREAFAEDVAERLARIRAAARGESLPDLLRDAHTLVSSAVVVGATEVSRAARALEEALLAGDPAAAPAALLLEELERWTA